jgi:hypothetical protein
MTQQYIGVKQITAWPQEQDGQPGYTVKYANGHTSWSPKDVFEAAYLPLGHIEALPPHVQRVVGERAINDDRLAKLRAFIAGSEVFAALPEAERARLRKQARLMTELSELLAERLEAMGA